MTHDLEALGIKPNRQPEARIRMGRKPTTGYGVEHKDRFTITLARASGSGKDARAELHPGFVAFNNLKVPSVFCRTLHGNIIHAHWESDGRVGDGCAYSRFSAHALPGVPSVPGGRPACSGDGRTARRYDGRQFRDIQCPGDLCEFRDSNTDWGRNVPVPCKRMSTFVLQLRWPDVSCRTCDGLKPAMLTCEDCKGRGRQDRTFPSVSAMIESGGSWSYATQQWWGFHASIVKQWEAIGGAGEPNIYSLPVRLTLTERTIPAKRSKIWVPEIYPDLPPGSTLQEFLLHRMRATEELRPALSGHAPLMLEGHTASAEEIADAVYDEVGAPPSKPART